MRLPGRALHALLWGATAGAPPATRLGAMTLSSGFEDAPPPPASSAEPDVLDEPPLAASPSPDAGSLEQLYEPAQFFENVDFRALHALIESGGSEMAKALMFGRIRDEASQLTAHGSLLADSVQRQIVDQPTLLDSMACILASRLHNQDLTEPALVELFRRVMASADLDVLLCQDLVEMTRKDAAIRSSLLQPFLFFKGFHAVQLQRIAHQLWSADSFEQRMTALALQSRMSEAYAVDLHPGAVLGPGLFMDHAHGVVVGETARVGARCTILHGVTLGATGRKEQGPLRHPQVGDDVVLGAHSCVLGNIAVGDRCVIGAHAINTLPVPADKTVVGLNKVLDNSMVPADGNKDTWQYEI